MRKCVEVSVEQAHADQAADQRTLQLLREWNDTSAAYSDGLGIHQLFEAQVEKTPDAVAVVFEHQRLSYRALNHQANRLAHHLIDLGVKPDGVVGLFLERSVEMVVAILAVLKAGGAYVPLDLDHPDARLEFMLHDAEIAIVLTKTAHAERLSDFGITGLALDDGATALVLDGHDTVNPRAQEIGVTSAHLAYVLYTSGSTGYPKGVMIEHRALTNRIEWMRDRYGCNASDIILQKTPYSFDVSVWEFFLPLISGARIVLAKPGGHKDPIYLSGLIRREGVTMLHFVPSMFNAMLTTATLGECQSLTHIFCSGEALQPHMVEMFFQQKSRAQLHNLYGPTEAAIDVSHWQCGDNDRVRTTIPIGRPIDNIQLYILDEELVPAAPGIAGELHIGGVGLARGYLNRADLTAQKFIPNPFSNGDGMWSANRLYKSGDLCRFLPDGNIEYLGRMDDQVKIRGFRIELGEVENVLLKHEQVRDAVVLSKELPTIGKCLVAYVVCNSETTAAVLRDSLGKTLPDYMIPSTILVLPELPLSSNGKVDRKALLLQEIAHDTTAPQHQDGMSFLHNEIHTIWKRVLGYENFGVDDDLFKVGGDSIAAIQIFSAVNNEFGVDIYLEKLFSTDHFSIRWLAELVETSQVNLVGEDEYSKLLQQIDSLSEEEVARLLAE